MTPKTKRLNTEKRKEQEFDALFNRIYDICCGAAGRGLSRQPDDPEGLLYPEDLSHAIPALEALFDDESDPKKYLFAAGNLDEYTDCAAIADFYYTHDVRA